MKAFFIYDGASICNQEAYENKGFSTSLKSIEENSDLIQPEYKAIIPPIKLRRMPKLSRMALACTLSLFKETQINQVEGIILGSGLGSLDDTERFLKRFIPAGDSLVPPVSFIQSGHNTVAGQIALYFGNKGYNMTHVQQHLSFENALIDAQLLSSENSSDVLFGAMDETIPFLQELAQRYGLSDQLIKQISEGGSFFVGGNNKDKAKAQVLDVNTYSNTANGEDKINEFLAQNKLSLSQLDKVLLGRNFSAANFEKALQPDIIYTDFCGQYFSSSAFGFHLALDLIQTQNASKVLLINTMGEKSFGLSLISNV